MRAYYAINCIVFLPRIVPWGISSLVFFRDKRRSQNLLRSQGRPQRGLSTSSPDHSGSTTGREDWTRRGEQLLRYNDTCTQVYMATARRCLWHLHANTLWSGWCYYNFDTFGYIWLWFIDKLTPRLLAPQNFALQNLQDLMMNWWWSDEELMMNWIWIDTKLMINWWWTYDELMNILRILPQQNTALLSYVCQSVSVCVTGVTSHYFSIVQGFRPYKPYIFWKVMIQGPQKQCSQVSDVQIHKYKYKNKQIQLLSKLQIDLTCAIFLKR